MGAQVNLPFVQFPLRWVKWLLVEPVRYWAGTTQLRGEFRELRGEARHLNLRVDKIVDLLHMIVAQLSGDWAPDQRERAQRMMGSLANGGVSASGIRPTSNPLTEEDVRNIHNFHQRFIDLDTFTPDEAIEFKRLAEIVLEEYPELEVSKDLLGMAWFAYAVYALAEQLKGNAT